MISYREMVLNSHGQIREQNRLPGENDVRLRQEKMHLKMSSAGVVCCKLLPNITYKLSKEANSVVPEQTAPIGAV